MFSNRGALERTPAHALALDCAEAAIEAAHPETVVREAVSLVDGTMTVPGGDVDVSAADRVVVVGGGNAAGTAASALEGVLGSRVDAGAVVTDAAAPTETIRVLEGDHPIPSERGVENTQRMLELARSAGESDLVIAVVTGGGSALLAAPAGDLAISDLQSVTDDLLRSGADIREINAVRKHLSEVKGGGLARLASPATVVGVVFSDVTGNDLGTIASGPTAPDETTYADALAVLERYDVSPPKRVKAHLERGVRREIEETLAPRAVDDERVRNFVLADNLTALRAAAETAAARGYQPLVLSSRIRGEAREAATVQVAIAEECRDSGHPIDPPAVVISGGETTVTGPDGGTGGPNQEFALGTALELDDPGSVLVSVDSDGIDGVADAAGGLVDHETVSDRTEALDALDAHDTHPFLDARGAALVTGPTGTNVNDIRVHVLEESTDSERA